MVYNEYGEPITLPLNPQPGTFEYNYKCDILADHLNDVSLYVKKLYKTTSTNGIAFNYFLYGEESPGIHEGVDVVKGSGENLYNIVEGKVVAKTNSTNLSVLGVYDSVHDVTVFYMHMNIAAAVPAVGSEENFKKASLIGTEDNRGYNIPTHTHIQIQSGLKTTAASGQDTTLTFLKPYAYLWFYCR